MTPEPEKAQWVIFALDKRRKKKYNLLLTMPHIISFLILSPARSNLVNSGSQTGIKVSE